ncbi:uncharacterized protein EURHEDRAFT_113603 [Aspergillus ruber CBS 135680]|uniref:Uncharacterized protein n=1 Tax=Aspergillus ruber (strain CBS 135680) TaxID=1388766 RepID=A0A017SA26_ASPRC|nr:uncharacterized protein EURHEDRAFT_113603 [Aspergillus ruber CBS 135680]EYE93908.1 hypothetical protein EURHEDRAFT_113603 [Aspergillus ruber CBS 135680]
MQQNELGRGSMCERTLGSMQRIETLGFGKRLLFFFFSSLLFPFPDCLLVGSCGGCCFLGV